MWFGIISIFPSMFNIIKDYGLTSYAYKRNILQLGFFNPKNYVNKNVYNKPYGGGKGVVMSFPPINEAVEDAKSKKPDSLVIYVSPKGKRVDNNIVFKLSKYNSIIFISGRYEDVDNRVLTYQVDLELSVGDFILSGGEIPIMIIIDSVCRLLPQVMKNRFSVNIESFNDSLLEYPQFTRPKEILGIKVPNILLGGNHKKIAIWRYKKRLCHTFLIRPDLLFNKQLSIKDKTFISEFIKRDYEKYATV